MLNRLKPWENRHSWLMVLKALSGRCKVQPTEGRAERRQTSDCSQQAPKSSFQTEIEPPWTTFHRETQASDPCLRISTSVGRTRGGSQAGEKKEEAAGGGVKRQEPEGKRQLTNASQKTKHKKDNKTEQFQSPRADGTGTMLQGSSKSCPVWAVQDMANSSSSHHASLGLLPAVWCPRGAENLGLLRKKNSGTDHSTHEKEVLLTTPQFSIPSAALAGRSKLPAH